MGVFTNKEHWDVLYLHLRTFKTFLDVYNRTAEGVRYYVNCTPEEDAIEHKQITKDILLMLRMIKKCDIGAYKMLTHLYKDELRDVVAVYRQSQEEAE